MPEKRLHRGPHPRDHELFAPARLPALRQATADLSWLLTRGYADRSALKLVGDRFQLTDRQRTAVARCACSDQALARRRDRQLGEAAVAGACLEIDGFNLITSVEAALAGGVLLLGRDGCLRDMASMHGSYRKVRETLPALERIGAVLDRLGVSEARWLLDQPVSNSGRLKTMIGEVARARGWRWRAELLASPDHVLRESPGPIATADSAILDRCAAWFNLARTVVQTETPEAWVVDLGADSPEIEAADEEATG